LPLADELPGLRTMPAPMTDTTIIIETGQAIMLLGFKGGCFVGAIVIEPQLEAKPLT